MTEPSDTIIREVCFKDLDAVKKLRKRLGLSPVTAERQRQLWETNPAIIERTPLSNGWVLESNGRIVGYLGNIPLLYRFENHDLPAAVASAFAVDSDHRNSSLKLLAAFFNQKNVDLLLATTVNAAAEQIFRFFKAKPVAQKEYDKVLFYVCNDRNFLKPALMKKNIPSAIAFVGSIALTPFLYGERMLKHRIPKGGGPNEIKVISVESIGNEFDELWQRKTDADSQRLYAYRTASFLRWHFERLPENMVKILCAYHRKTLVGYAVVMRENVMKIGIKRDKIVDLFVENDDINTIDQLIRASYDHAKKEGASILEMIGFPEFVRSRFAIGNPYSRTLPNWPYFYKTINASCRKVLKSEDVWYASPFDGDASL